MQILEVKQIRHFYNGKKVLDIPSLIIEKGETYSVVGPNGSGKTTLLSIMGLILKPTHGEVIFNGRCVHYNNKSLLAVRRSITMVFQNPYLFNLSVGENVAYGLKARKIAKKERGARIKDALHLAGLGGFENRRAKRLSGGETQLVALARALVLDPVILLLDEPTANVDSKHVKRFEAILSKINREKGITILMTTHNLSQAYRMTREVFSLYNGSITSSPMFNLFSGRVSIKEKTTFFNTEKTGIQICSDVKSTNITHISIDPEDIIVSKEPFSSSARNIFEGVISKIINQGDKVLLEVESSETFMAYITHLSLQEMGLTIGSRVYLTFKASCVHIL